MEHHLKIGLVLFIDYCVTIENIITVITAPNINIFENKLDEFLERSGY